MKRAILAIIGMGLGVATSGLIALMGPQTNYTQLIFSWSALIFAVCLAATGFGASFVFENPGRALGVLMILSSGPLLVLGGHWLLGHDPANKSIATSKDRLDSGVDRRFRNLEQRNFERAFESYLEANRPNSIPILVVGFVLLSIGVLAAIAKPAEKKKDSIASKKFVPG